MAVTGGEGFLGRSWWQTSQAWLPERSSSRSRNYDSVRQTLSPFLVDARPDLVIHLAARVGGIGANRANPGRFFYDNLMMGVQLIEEARRRGIPKSSPSAPCAPTRSSHRYRSARTTSGTATRRKPTPPTAWPRRCSWCRPGVPQQYGFNAILLLPVNLYGPGDNFDPASLSRDPGADQQVRRGAANAEPPRSKCGGRPATREFLYVEDAAEAIVLATERYDARSR